MGCGTSRSDVVLTSDVVRPESDVDVASVKDFDQEHEEAVALQQDSREYSAASCYSRHSEASKKEKVEDELSVKSVQGEIPPLAPPRRSKEDLLRHYDAASSALYQLMEKPVDLVTFSTRLKLDPLAYHVGLTPLTHRDGVIDDVKHDVTVKFNVTKGPLRTVTAYLVDRADETSKKDRSGVLTSLEDDGTTCRVYVRPARAAIYLLTVMGQAGDIPRGKDFTLRRTCVYVIRCTCADPAFLPFPENNGPWGLQQPVAAECGVQRVKGTTFEFTTKDGAVTVPLGLRRHTEVAVKLRHADDAEEDLARYTFVEYGDDDAVEIRARLPRSGYFLLRVFASHPEVQRLQHVADFLLFSHAPFPRCQPFPVSSDFAHANRTRLLEPLARELARGVTSLFRVRVPSLSSVRVNGVRMVRRGFQGVWEAEVTPADEGGKAVLISCSTEEGATKLYGLYTFDVV